MRCVNTLVISYLKKVPVRTCQEYSFWFRQKELISAYQYRTCLDDLLFSLRFLCIYVQLKGVSLLF